MDSHVTRGEVRLLTVFEEKIRFSSEICIDYVSRLYVKYKVCNQDLGKPISFQRKAIKLQKEKMVKSR